jgi:hypothetical protein
MKYMLLIFDDEVVFRKIAKEEQQPIRPVQRKR